MVVGVLSDGFPEHAAKINEKMRGRKKPKAQEQVMIDLIDM